MNTDYIRDEQQKIIDEINNIKWDNQDIKPISDGIVDIESYLNADLKIMWINKEVNSTEEDADWNLRDVLSVLRTDDGVVKGWAGTFNPIIYTVYGILNDKNWKDIPDTWVALEIIDCLKQIAYVNVKKIPGGAVASKQDLNSFYKEFESILERQITLFNPDIIICGSTYGIIEDTLYRIYDEKRKLKFEIDNSDKRTVFFKNKEVLIVDALHPNSRMNKQDYCDGIINGVLQWKMKRFN